MKTAFTVAFVVAFVVVLLSTAGCATTGSSNISSNTVELEQSPQFTNSPTDKTLSSIIDILGAWYLDCH